MEYSVDVRGGTPHGSLSLGKSNCRVFAISFLEAVNCVGKAGMADTEMKDARSATKENFKKFLAIGPMADIL
jgi:hypothetical protein